MLSRADGVERLLLLTHLSKGLAAAVGGDVTAEKGLELTPLFAMELRGSFYTVHESSCRV